MFLAILRHPYEPGGAFYGQGATPEEALERAKDDLWGDMRSTFDTEEEALDSCREYVVLDVVEIAKVPATPATRPAFDVLWD